MAKKIIKDNKGSAIVMVLVAIAFVGILASMVMYGTFMNYQVKVMDWHAKENFYSAQMAMDEIRAGLQNHVSNAFSIAYLEALEDYGMDEIDRRSRFQQKYMEVLSSYLRKEGSSGKYDLETLQSFVSQPAKAVLSSSEDCTMVSYTDGLRLKGVTVTYTDEDEYVSIIDTDFLLQIPELNLGNAYEYPEITDCVLIANEKLVAYSRADIQGSVYGGKQGIFLEEDARVHLQAYTNQKGETIPVNVVTDSAISLGEDASDPVSFQTGEDVTLWAGGIDVVSTSDVLSLKGTNYIKDDLTVKGNGAKISLAGKYIGFGNRISKAEDSSSIIINGKDAVLDMQELKELVLAGSAYIAASDLESGKDTNNNDNEENEDILTGSSVSGKAEQIAYLVPAEFVGYDMQEQRTIIGQNPVNVKDPAYQKFMTETLEKNPQRYREVNLHLTDSSLGKSLSSYGATYEKVYYQTADGALWAYYYLKFMSTENANEFFRDYYANSENRELLNSYIGKYIKELKVSENLKNGTEDFRLELAGNMIEVVSGEDQNSYHMISATDKKDVDEQISLSSEFTLYNNRFMGMCKKMTTDFFSLKDTEVMETSDIYSNLIKSDSEINAMGFTEVVTRFDNGVTGAIALFIQEGAAIDSLEELISGVVSAEEVGRVHLIVTEKNIEIDQNFTGLIISKEEISIRRDVELKAYEKLTEVLVSKYVKADGGEVLILDLFKDGVSPTTSSPEGADGENQKTYTAEELVIYENWTKK